MDYVIGCDVGSQGVKVIMVSAEGQIIAEASSSYGIDYPKPTWAEQPVDTWINAIHDSIPRLLNESGVNPSDVKAIGLDAQVDGVVPVDEAGAALRPAIIWMDRRAVAQSDAVQQSCDVQRLFELSGLNLDPYHVALKIRWFAENQPELDDKTLYYLLPGSYVAHYLTGEYGVDYSNASSALLMDVTTKTWSQELCACFEVPKERLAPIYPATQVIGSLRSAVADRLGLDKRTKVILGCGDEHAACLGAGVIKPGLVCDIAGTAEPVCAAAIEPLFDSTRLVETHSHAHPDLWLLENPGFVSGANYRWFRDQFAQKMKGEADRNGIDVYELLNQGAAQIPPGSEGLVFLPCLMGAVTPTWNSNARGTFIGFTLSHEWKHFVRAILEGTAYALRDITDRMKEINLDVQEIRAVGGGAKGELLRQIKADVTGLPVSLLQTTETTALGAAMLAMFGAGMVTTLEEAVETIIQTVETRDPDPERQAIYEDYYQFYRATYFALLPVFDQAARIT